MTWAGWILLLRRPGLAQLLQEGWPRQGLNHDRLARPVIADVERTDRIGVAGGRAHSEQAVGAHVLEEPERWRHRARHAELGFAQDAAAGDLQAIERPEPEDARERGVHHRASAAWRARAARGALERS